MENNYIGDSQLSGVVHKDIKYSAWMEDLIQSEAARTDLDEVANPEELDEKNLYNTCDYKYVIEQHKDEFNEQPWSKPAAKIEHELQDNSSRTIKVNTTASNSINNEVKMAIEKSKTKSLSALKNELTDKFNNKIALRYIKHNYASLKNSFADDINLDSSRIEDVEIHLGSNLKANDKKVKYTVAEVKKTAEELLPTSKNVLADLEKEYDKSLVKEAFPTDESFKSFVASKEKFIFDSIDHQAKNLTLAKRDLTKVTESLNEKFGEEKTSEYLKKSNLKRLAQFVNSRHDSSRLDRLSAINESTDVKELERNKQKEITAVALDNIELFAINAANKCGSVNELKKVLANEFGEAMIEHFSRKRDLNKIAAFARRNDDKNVVDRQSALNSQKDTNALSGREKKADFNQIKKEASIKISKRESLKNVYSELERKYGSDVVKEFKAKENLSSLEHKLGYFYVDANCFDNCDKMTQFFNKHLKYALLLKKREACTDCKMNTSGICIKTSLILSSNPLDISRRDGKRIIKAAAAMKLLPANKIEAYMKDLRSDQDNTPVIKSFLGELKQAAKLEKDPSKKAALGVKKLEGNEFRQTFNESDMNDFNINSLNEEIKPLDISFANLI